MKDTQLCPKCNFKDILRIPARMPAASTENITTVGWMNAVKVTR